MPILAMHQNFLRVSNPSSPLPLQPRYCCTYKTISTRRASADSSHEIQRQKYPVFRRPWPTTWPLTPLAYTVPLPTVTYEARTDPVVHLVSAMSDVWLISVAGMHIPAFLPDLPVLSATACIAHGLACHFPKFHVGPMVVFVTHASHPRNRSMRILCFLSFIFAGQLLPFHFVFVLLHDTC